MSFQVGDRVRRSTPISYAGMNVGEVYTVEKVDDRGDIKVKEITDGYSTVLGVKVPGPYWLPGSFELVQSAADVEKEERRDRDWLMMRPSLSSDDAKMLIKLNEKYSVNGIAATAPVEQEDEWGDTIESEPFLVPEALEWAKNLGIELKVQCRVARVDDNHTEN